MNTLITHDRLQELVRIGNLAAPNGPIAEVGVYKGGSLKYLADAFPDRRLYGFDTFEGLPAAHHSPDEIHKPGEFSDTHVDSVARFINNPRVQLIKGFFPDTGNAFFHDREIRFSLVHIDTDFHLSVRACIEWFVPRMLPGGVIVFDDFDWPNCPGVRRALEESGLRWIPTRATYQAAIWDQSHPIIVKNDNDLIGDFLGTVPAMQELERSVPIEVICKDSVAELLSMAGLKRSMSDKEGLSFDLHRAFAYAAANDLHMTQANFKIIGLDVPPAPAPPSLEYQYIDVPVFDYILSPFSRSLPPHERWPQERWAQLVRAMPDKTFALIGGPSDDPEYIPGIAPLMGKDFHFVCNLLMSARQGLISVVTGTSHLAYALGVPNFLFCNQGAWGKNPDAIIFPGMIPDISVDEAVKKLKEWG